MTIKDRLPIILTKIVDVVSRQRERFHEKEVDCLLGEDMLKELFLQEAMNDIKSIAGQLGEMRYRMVTDKSLLPIDSACEGADVWNEEIEAVNGALTASIHL